MCRTFDINKIIRCKRNYYTKCCHFMNTEVESINHEYDLFAAKECERESDCDTLHYKYHCVVELDIDYNSPKCITIS